MNSLQDVIYRLEKVIQTGATDKDGMHPISAERVLEELKSITDRPQGEWLNYKDEHTCSICKEVVIDDWYYEYEWYDFCPHCGTRMKGADDVER